MSSEQLFFAKSSTAYKCDGAGRNTHNIWPVYYAIPTYIVDMWRDTITINRVYVVKKKKNNNNKNIKKKEKKTICYFTSRSCLRCRLNGTPRTTTTTTTTTSYIHSDVNALVLKIWTEKFMASDARELLLWNIDSKVDRVGCTLSVWIKTTPRQSCVISFINFFGTATLRHVELKRLRSWSPFVCYCLPP